MPRHKQEMAALQVARCEKCHHSNLFRMAHLLRREDQGKHDTREHLQQQFPEMKHGDSWPWVDHEIGYMLSIRQMYGGPAEVAWVNWLKAHDAIRRVAGGWMIGA